MSAAANTRRTLGASTATGFSINACFPWLTASKLPDLILFVPKRQGPAANGELPTHVRTPEGQEMAVFGQELATEVRDHEPRMALTPGPRGTEVIERILAGARGAMVLLEIGFGPGIAIQEFARRATNGLVVGVDHSEVMVQQARKRNAAAVRAGRVDLRLGSAEALPRFDAPFDKILAVNSLLFWDDPVARLKELHDRLRQGGQIAIVYQPRGPGPTDEVAARTGQQIAAHFTEVGFTEVHVETLALKPTNVVCVLGVS